MSDNEFEGFSESDNDDDADKKNTQPRLEKMVLLTQDEAKQAGQAAVRAYLKDPTTYANPTIQINDGIETKLSSIFIEKSPNSIEALTQFYKKTSSGLNQCTSAVFSELLPSGDAKKNLKYYAIYQCPRYAPADAPADDTKCLTCKKTQPTKLFQPLQDKIARLNATRTAKLNFLTKEAFELHFKNHHQEERKVIEAAMQAGMASAKANDEKALKQVETAKNSISGKALAAMPISTLALPRSKSQNTV